MSRRELKPRTTCDKKGRIVIPQQVREEIGIVEGETMFEIEIYGDTKILLTPLTPLRGGQ